jgi:Protein of unknown function (DUF2877)
MLHIERLRGIHGEGFNNNIISLNFMKNPIQRVFKPTSIGSIASEILSKDQEAHVFGKNSKGVFIKTSGKWLVFLSFEQFKGPLTITFGKINPILRLVANGDPIRIAAQSIFIPGLDITIPVAASEVWQPPLPSALLLGDPERQEKLVYFAREILSKKNGVGLGSLIPPLLGLANSDPSPQKINGFNWADIQQLRNYIRIAQAVPLAGLLSVILGSGPGLTPSADDFIVGLLLTLNRWQIPPWTAGNLRALNFQVVQAAYQKTTTLSANLIECATLGLANERLVDALDWMMTGVARETEMVDHLLGWGSSSGVDAFVGMAVSLHGN